ncbi:MAG: YeeE/YedE thiosulfate transporter family protein [Bacteroidota bacterium]|nr:YeeE/YedE thiosulfate transporter family protein [Bacteroidota bacterium]
MAPLVPEIISEGLNFLIAFIIGIGFGFVLEQAGFSSSKKLAGLFYGKDFTVLRVFFTAAITAMIGIQFLGYFDLLDLELIYINPTYLWSAIIGGIVMGVGFILGGFCPGTSVCAAAIGKIDAMAFIFGSLIGILIFTEGFPLFEEVFNSDYWGNVHVYNSLGISSGLFGLLLIIMAIFAFIVTTIIENKVNNRKGMSINIVMKKYGFAIGLTLTLGLILLNLPTKEERLLSEFSDKGFIEQQEFKYFTTDQIAYHLIDKNNSIQIIDVRDSLAFKKFNLPTSVNITYYNLLDKQWSSLIDKNKEIHLFYSDNELLSKKASIISERLGYKNNFVLKGGITEFNKLIMQPTEHIAKNTQQASDYRFRTKAKTRIIELIKELKNSKKIVIPKKRKVIKGGC